jgi:hypothetical protein
MTLVTWCGSPEPDAHGYLRRPRDGGSRAPAGPQLHPVAVHLEEPLS